MLIQITFAAIMLFFGGLTIYNYLNPKLQELKRIKERQKEINKIELTYNGGGTLYLPPNWSKKVFNYNLRSWDSGKTWYAVEFNKDCSGRLPGFKILGNADELYPGLIEHIEGWDTLSKHVEKNGPIEADSIGLNILKKAGFTVKKIR